MGGSISQSQPKFVTFGISHYCEKARWALDWHGIAYDEINWPPGVHIVLAKSCGAKQTSLPILLDGRRVIQGSGAIIDWADRHNAGPGSTAHRSRCTRDRAACRQRHWCSRAPAGMPSCFRDFRSWLSPHSLAKRQARTDLQRMRCGL